jgi:hypothetical protein
MPFHEMVAICCGAFNKGVAIAGYRAHSGFPGAAFLMPETRLPAAPLAGGVSTLRATGGYL